MEPRLLPAEEPEVSSFVAREFERSMTVHLNVRAIAARPGKSSKIVTFEDVKTGQTGEADGEEILVAVGRRSNADVLQAGKTGVATDARGWIKADEYLETTIPGIWAIGDAIGGYQFRHKANYDSDICVHNLFESLHPRIPVDYSVVPWAVYTHPPGRARRPDHASGARSRP